MNPSGNLQLLGKTCVLAVLFFIWIFATYFWFKNSPSSSFMDGAALRGSQASSFSLYLIIPFPLLLLGLRFAWRERDAMKTQPTVYLVGVVCALAPGIFLLVMILISFLLLFLAGRGSG